VPTARPAKETKAKILDDNLNDISHIGDDEGIDPDEHEANEFRNA
jgi:hypothetical protein